MPLLRSPPAHYLSQAMQPLQDALLRAGLPGEHWKEGGHDKLCKKTRKGGGAEQYHANTTSRTCRAWRSR